MCFLFLDPQDEVGPSISSSVVLCSFVLLVYIVVLVLGSLFVTINVKYKIYRPTRKTNDSSGSRLGYIECIRE